MTPDAIPDPWRLIASGHYQQAREAYTKRIEGAVWPRPFDLRNRAVTHLLEGDALAALADYGRAAAATDARLLPDTDYLARGVCHWYLDQPDRSVALWREALRAPYTDAAGGVEAPALLLYAAVRLPDAALAREALALLRQLASVTPQAWPAPLVPFLLGKITAADLEHRAASTSPILTERWRCQATFYVALRALREGDQPTFRARMATCAASPQGPHHHEHFLAKWECDRGFPSPAF